MREAKRRLQTIYDEIGENCPLLAAKHMGITVSTMQGMDDICGWYYPTFNGHRRVLLSTDHGFDTMIDTCTQLVLHHMIHDGVSVKLTKCQVAMRSSLLGVFGEVGGAIADNHRTAYNS